MIINFATFLKIYLNEKVSVTLEDYNWNGSWGFVRDTDVKF